MTHEKSVKIVNFKYQKSYNKLTLHRGMATLKYSYVLWSLFGIFIVALWIGLYVGYVLPVEKSFVYKETTCKTTSWTKLPPQYDQQCDCESSTCPQKPKTFPCFQIYVNYTVSNSQGQHVKHTMLRYSEAVLGKNVSWITYFYQTSHVDLTQSRFTSWISKISTF